MQNVVVEPGNQNPDSLTFADGTTAATVIENVAGATLGTLKGHDPDADDPVQQPNLFDGPRWGSERKIPGVGNSSTGYVLKLKDDVSLDYETATSYTVTVRVSDGAWRLQGPGLHHLCAER